MTYEMRPESCITSSPLWAVSNRWSWAYPTVEFDTHDPAYEQWWYLLASQTLGEEYCDVVQIDARTGRYPSIKVRWAAWTILRASWGYWFCLIPSSVEQYGCWCTYFRLELWALSIPNYGLGLFHLLIIHRSLTKKNLLNPQRSHFLGGLKIRSQLGCTCYQTRWILELSKA